MSYLGEAPSLINERKLTSTSTNIQKQIIVREENSRRKHRSVNKIGSYDQDEEIVGSQYENKKGKD